jgi:hypothetical protein
MNDFPRTAEQARIDRDATRQEIAQTLDALVHKLNVKDRVSTKVNDTVDRAKAKITDVVPASTAQRLRHHVQAVRNNPLPFLAALVSFFIAIRVMARRRD